MQKITTTNLSDFGFRELVLLEKLLKTLREQGLPKTMSSEGRIP